MKKYILWISILALFATTGYTKENVENVGKKRSTTPVRKLAAGCDPASASNNLDVNNVRARIMNGGDMWWDLVGTAMYEVPKVTEEGETKKTALFAGALWIGGYDDGDNLRAAAMTYRQQSSWDFFPGPLSTTDATISQTDCIKWDKIYQVTREEIDEFIENSSSITDNIRYWPAHGEGSEAQYLAPFVDVNENGIYDPDAGDDYPDVLGDQTLWFVYNDKGNTHTETDALAIGLEVQTQAFAFATNDEINNMTFYQQKIINRSKNKLSKVYFGQWVDADLGYAYDDFVGCDSTRSLGICYNGDAFDEGVTGYGSNPPSVGVDFFQGPLADENDGIDNDKDGEIDEEGEEIIMSKFVYYNNDWSYKGNPSEGIHFYYYLTGRFKNKQIMRYGGDGFNQIWENERANYMFPDDPRDPYPAWSEVTSGNTPADRRFLQSAGPFTLKPGAINYITVGVVWARATSGGNTGSYDLLLIADDKAQKLYNNNFDLLDGPDAPDLTIQELDRELILSLENTLSIERYYDSIVSENGNEIHYKFQGYLIYQLYDGSVTTAELNNTDKARLVARVDIKDQIDQLVNIEYVAGLGNVPTEMVDANGDDGIKHTFSITQDAFASDETQLVNFKTYYYLVLSYANVTDDPDEPEQFLAGRKNIETYTGIPHSNDIEFNGTQLGSSYGDGPQITRIEGTGNGGMTLELTEESKEEILENVSMAHPVYQANSGPINVYVYDPLKVPTADFEFKFIDSKIATDPDDFKLINDDAKWMLIKKDPAPEESVLADTIYGVDYEQIIPDWGLALKIDKVFGPTTDTLTENNGFIEATLVFEDASKMWLTGFYDSDPTDLSNWDDEIPWPYNWIRSGKLDVDNEGDADLDIDDYMDANSEWFDPNEIFEDMLSGRIAPFALVARNKTNANGYQTFGPAHGSSQPRDFDLGTLPSIDLVFTPKGAKDKKYWTQCMVVETGDDNTLTEGNAEKFDARNHYSWTGESNNGEPVYDANERGRSWFPGYAINVETGERLNIIFGEDSYFEQENGRDMLWNPTHNYTNPAASTLEIDKYPWGGKHWLYIMDTKENPSNGLNTEYCSAYDHGEKYLELFESESYSLRSTSARKLWGQCLYTMLPVLNSAYDITSIEDGMVPNEAKIRIRVEKPYATYQTSNEPENNNIPFYSFSTSEIAMTNSDDLGENAMEKINIVPNPYYAFSTYEKNQLDSRVKIINLPRKCDIYIYTLSGSLVRKFTKDESEEEHQPYQDWDLKNNAGIPIASGLYIIYIDGFELGSKILKWFGITSPIDLDTL